MALQSFAQAISKSNGVLLGKLTIPIGCVYAGTDLEVLEKAAERRFE
jgi:hypothetical protein